MVLFAHGKDSFFILFTSRANKLIRGHFFSFRVRWQESNLRKKRE
jgi:hypothetical protein